MEQNNNDSPIGGINQGIVEHQQVGGEVLGRDSETSGRDSGSDSGRNSGSGERDTGTSIGTSKGRGRKRKSDSGGSETDYYTGKPENSEKEENPPALAFEVEDTFKDKKTRKKRVSKKDKSFEESKESAFVLLMLFDGFMANFVSVKAVLSQEERLLIEDPLARTLARMSPQTSEFIEKYTDPILVLFGFGMWGYRMTKLFPTNSPKRKESKKEETQEEETSPFNGATPSADLMSLFNGV